MITKQGWKAKTILSHEDSSEIEFQSSVHGKTLG